MHYYQFNIGDYAKTTRHLTNLEDLAYRRLIELYYDTEKPLCNDVKKLSRLINMRENQEEIETVLEDFFTETEEGFFQSRIEEEIAAYKERAEKARANGKKGGRPKKANANPEETERKAKKTQSVNLANPEETGSKANQEPITNNHKPITNNQLKDIDTNVSCENDTRLSPRNVVDLYNLKFKGLYPRQMRELTPNRQTVIRARIKNDFKTIEEWAEFFELLKKSDFLMGRVEPYGGRKVFQLSLDWICKPENLANILEGKYHG